MKSLSFLALALLLSACAGCSHWPKDSLIRGAEVVTPWGRTSAEVIATGTAARNLSAEDRAALLAPPARNK